MAQGLEPRTLFAAMPVVSLADVSTFKSDVAALRASISQAAPTVVADLRILGQNLQGLPNSGANRAMLATLRSDELKALSLLKADAAAMARVVGAKVAGVVNAGARQAKQPSTKAQVQFSAALSELQSAEDAVLNRFANDVQTIGAKVSADMSVLAVSNPTALGLQSGLTKTQNDFAAAFAAMQSHVQAAQTQFYQLMSDLTAWK